MKIILREHVDHLGKRGETVSVANGYARNFLLPKGFAYEATPGNLKQLEHQHKRWEVKEAGAVAVAEAMAARLAAVELSVTKKAGESGTLYGSVTSVEVAELLGAQGIKVDRRKLVIDEPIKSVGEFVISLRLHRKVVGKIKLVVKGETSAEDD